MTCRFDWQWLSVAAACVMAAGCDSHPYDLADVSGKVTLDGQPLAGAIVNTQPIATGSSSSPGPGSFGKTDEQGRFTLELATRAVPGAVVGPHRVTIRMPDSGDTSDEAVNRKTERARLPQAALDGSLRLNVPVGGSNDALFELQARRRQ